MTSNLSFQCFGALVLVILYSLFHFQLHVVNFNEEKYHNLSNAMSKERDGLAVLGFWFKVNFKAKG